MAHPPRRRTLVVLGACVGLLVSAVGPSWGQAAKASGTAPRPSRAGWAATWTMGQIAPIGRQPAARFAARGFDDQTFREVVHVSAGGSTTRLRFSNAFGRSPLVIAAVSLGAQQLGASLDAAVGVHFAGARSVTIPPGGAVSSDAVGFTVDAGATLAVSMFFPRATGPVAWHRVALETSYSTVARSGDHTMDQSAASYVLASGSWYVLSGVDVLQPPRHPTVVAFGDSITDGNGSTSGLNHRWSDILWSRLEQRGYPLAVVDAGIGGNRLLSDERGNGGPSGISRLGRDALDQPGARALVLLEGINDIFAGATSAAIIGGMRRVISEAHREDVTVIGATLTPVCRTGVREARRLEVNAFIRNGHAFDATIDFAAAVQDPGSRSCLAARFDSGDHVHLNDAGYAAMAGAVSLAMVAASAGAGPPVANPSLPAGAVVLLAACVATPVALLFGRRLPGRRRG